MAVAEGATPLYAQQWRLQTGTPTFDDVRALIPDGVGGAFVALSQANNTEAVLKHVDSAGDVVWTRMLIASAAPFDSVNAGASDGSSGFYVVGGTTGALFGPSFGGVDVWITHHDATGELTWSTQIGGSGGEVPTEVTPDGSGGLLLCGTTNGNFGGTFSGEFDGWVGRIDASGNLLWVKQFGSTEFDYTDACAPDGAGGAYVAGRTLGSISGAFVAAHDIGDSWIARVNSQGTLMWLQQYGVPFADGFQALASDGAGGVFAAGWISYCSLECSDFHDIRVVHFHSSGSVLWERKFGTQFKVDDAWTAVPDTSGGLYLAGTTNGSLYGQGKGALDVWQAHVDGTGTLLSAFQFGSSTEDILTTLALDGQGRHYLGGRTFGALFGPRLGGYDGWVLGAIP